MAAIVAEFVWASLNILAFVNHGGIRRLLAEAPKAVGILSDHRFRVTRGKFFHCDAFADRYALRLTQAGS